MLPDSDLECQPVGKVKIQLRNNTRKLGILFAACVPAGSLVSAQDQDFSKVQLKVTKVAGNIYMMDTKPAPHDALPIITFDHDVTVHLNGEDIRALYFPAGHTDGDSIVFFPHSNVVHMGDDFVTYGCPFIVASGAASMA